MEPAENKNYSNDIILRLSPKNHTVTVEELKAGNIVAYKEISAIDLYFALLGGNVTLDFLDSGFLPEHCLSISMSSAEKHIFLWNPELRADVAYGSIEYPDFPLPRLVFGMRLLENGRVAECSMGVVADEVPKPDTIMYHYPFSNLYPHENGRVCTGNNVLPRYRDLRKLVHFPQYLLGIPDNDDFYDPTNNRLGLNHGELMEHLKDKNPAYYYSDILIPNGERLSDFINRR